MNKNNNNSNNVNNNTNNNSSNNVNNNANNKTKKPQAFETYALAEKSKIDNNTKAARPSDSQVENMRDFSIENKK